MRRAILFSCLTAGFLVVGCKSIPGNVKHAQNPPTFFPGNVTHADEDAMLAEGSVVTVRLLDVIDGERHGRVIATDTIEIEDEEGAEFPIAFEIRYDAWDTVPDGKFAVDATIADANGRTTHRSETEYVLTDMHPYMLRALEVE